MEHGIIESLKNIKDCILSVIYCTDDVCIVCGNELYSDKFICNCCANKIMICTDKTQIGLGNVRFECYSGTYYSGPVTELVIKLKYKSSFRSGNVMAKYMYETIKSNKLDFNMITYVPMTKKDLKKRGYNQSEYLAKVLKDYVDKPVIECLVKVKSTKDQIGLDKNDRWNNIEGSFRIIDKSIVKNKNILLIDDVITTGATAFYSALELKNSGANKIIILTGAKSKV
ncbi:ComF family protein [Clostridium sp. LBM24168]